MVAQLHFSNLTKPNENTKEPPTNASSKTQTVEKSNHLPITNKNTLEFLGVWENLKNNDFNYTEFGVIKNEADVNRFIMSVGQWIERTDAIGIIVYCPKISLHLALCKLI